MFAANLLIAAALAATPPAEEASAPPAPPAPPPATLASYFSSADYPREALKRKEQGTVRFRLGINAEGRVSSCTILASSGSPALDSTTCRLIAQRARFRPARDDEGRPVADEKDYQVTWVLPE